MRSAGGGLVAAVSAGLIASLVWLSLARPAVDPWWLAVAAMLVTFFSASQDIVVRACRRES